MADSVFAIADEAGFGRPEIRPTEIPFSHLAISVNSLSVPMSVWRQKDPEAYKYRVLHELAHEELGHHQHLESVSRASFLAPTGISGKLFGTAQRALVGELDALGGQDLRTMIWGNAGLSRKAKLKMIKKPVGTAGMVIARLKLSRAERRTELEADTLAIWRGVPPKAAVKDLREHTANGRRELQALLPGNRNFLRRVRLRTKWSVGNPFRHHPTPRARIRNIRRVTQTLG